MYPASANFGILIRAECSHSTMFISLAASRRLCLSSILFVAFPVLPSGNIKVFLDGCPVSSRSGLTSSGAAPEVAPESRNATCLSLLILNFRAQCNSCLLGGIPLPIAARAVLMLAGEFWCGPFVVGESDFGSSCSLTRQVSGDQ